MGLPRDRRLICYMISLKQHMTPAEKYLWTHFLRTYTTPFRQQKIIGPYIVDFFCNKARISIELDGSHHFEERVMKKDAIRTTYLEMLEIKELRFTNVDIWENFEGVCEVIHEEVNRRRNDISYISFKSLQNKK